MCKFEHAVHCEIVRTDSIPANIPLPGFPSWSLILLSFFQQRSGGGAADEYINLFDIYLSTCAAWRLARPARLQTAGDRGAGWGRRDTRCKKRTEEEEDMDTFILDIGVGNGRGGKG